MRWQPNSGAVMVLPASCPTHVTYMPLAINMSIRSIAGIIAMALRAAVTIALPTDLKESKAGSGFLSSCSDDYVEIRSGSMFLSSNCRNDRGEKAVVRIDLDDCLSNSNGKLVCLPPNGGFWRTCEYNRKTTYDTGVLSMHCRNATGFLDWSSYDLSK